MIEQGVDDIFPDYTQSVGPFVAHNYVTKPVIASQLPTCHLVIILQPKRIRYFLISPQGEILRAHFFESTGVLNDEIFIRFVFEKEDLLRGPFVRTDVVVMEGPFFLVPAAFHRPEKYGVLARLLLDGTLFPDEVKHHYALQGKAQLVLALNPEWEHLLSYYLGQYRLRHVVSPLLDIDAFLPKEDKTGIICFQDEKRLIIAAYENRECILCNVFPCRSEADRLYFLQGARSQFKKNPDSCPLILTGNASWIHDNNELEKYAYNFKPYISQISKGDLPAKVQEWLFLLEFLMKEKAG